MFFIDFHLLLFMKQLKVFLAPFNITMVYVYELEPATLQAEK
jgi:hypothetical protein